MYSKYQQLTNSSVVSDNHTQAGEDDETITNIELYKRGELGERIDKIEIGRVGRGDRRTDFNETTLGGNTQKHKQRRGDDGVVEESENPERHLRDRLHENYS